MACGSCGGSTWQAGGSTAKVGGKTLYAVITDGGAGRVAYQSHRLDLVVQVRARYEGSTIVPEPTREALVAAGLNPAQDETAETPVKTRSRKASDAPSE